jgi:hypothetical protein
MKKYYWIYTDYDSSGNSRWDCLWIPREDPSGLAPLQGGIRLKSIWKCHQAHYQKRFEKPDVYSVESHFGLEESTSSIFEDLLGDMVELLPIRDQNGKIYYIIHPLALYSLDTATIDENGPGKHYWNISKYIFNDNAINNKHHVFRFMSREGTPGRDYGFGNLEVIVSEKFKRLYEKHNMKGIVFNPLPR